MGVYTRKHDFLGLLFYEIVFTALFGALASAFYPFPSPAALHSLIPALVYLAVVCTVVVNALQLYGQRFTSNVEAAIIYLLEPVFAAILSYIFLGEVLTVNQVMGAALILLSMGAASVKPGEPIEPQAQLPSTMEPAKQP